MFKKPLGHLKTSAPLRSSDRRKLRQRVVSAYNLTPEEGDALVPEGIMSVKFMTHVDAQGVAYLSADGDPLWFTLGKSADDPLLPSVYTLWKKEDMLPFLSTPAAVVPILVGGADLMIPGVIHSTPDLPEGTLVSIRQYNSSSSSASSPASPSLSPPIAVGRLAQSSDAIKAARRSEETNKGKAVIVLHTWKDHLWEMGGGSRREMPPATPISIPTAKAPVQEDEEDVEDESEESEEGEDEGESEEGEDGDEQEAATQPPVSRSPTPAPDTQLDSATTTTTPVGVTYTSAEVSTLLELALVQAIAKRLSGSSEGANAVAKLFPIPATKFYTDYILPCRPGFPTLVLPPSSSGSAPAPSNPTDASPNDFSSSSINDADPPPILTDLTIKSSSYKTLSAFLKAMERAGLLSLKSPPKKSAQNDLLVTAVNSTHEKVKEHERVHGAKGFATVADVERTQRRREERREREEGGGGGGGGGSVSEGRKPLTVRELYSPEGVMKDVFDAFGLGSSSTETTTPQRYTAPEIRTALTAYIAREGLVNAADRAYVNLDEVLGRAVASAGVIGIPSVGASAGSVGQKKAKEDVKAKSKGKATEGVGQTTEEPVQWLRRDGLAKTILGSKKLQPWHEISAHRGGGEVSVLIRKGTLQPISITSKTRAGRKVVTSISGFEPFLSLPYSKFATTSGGGGGGSAGNDEVTAEEMADDLRKLCAGATTVGPTQAGTGIKLPSGVVSQTVTVQGKQGKVVLEYLVGKGVPKEWISVDK